MITARLEVAPSDPSVPFEESDGIRAVHPVGRTAKPVPFHAAAGASAGSDGLCACPSDRVAPTAYRSRAVRSDGPNGRPPDRAVALVGRPIRRPARGRPHGRPPCYIRPSALFLSHFFSPLFN